MNTTTTRRDLARQVALQQLARHGAVRPCPTTTQGLPCRHEAGHLGACSVRLLAGQSIVLRAV